MWCRRGSETEYQARLVVAADGKLSAARRWTGGETVVDQEHHRFGGVLVADGHFARGAVNYAWNPGEMVIWFAAGSDHTRLYVTMQADRLRATGIDRSFDAFIGFAAERLPEGALSNAKQAGPVGFFPNSCIWASELVGHGVVLIGDAAGAPDPSQGHGTSLVFWDVRQLSELLLESTNWDGAIRSFAERRRHVYNVIRTIDHWWQIFFDTSDEATRRLEGHLLAREHDPTVGGLARIEITAQQGSSPTRRRADGGLVRICASQGSRVSGRAGWTVSGPGPHARRPTGRARCTTRRNVRGAGLRLRRGRRQLPLSGRTDAGLPDPLPYHAAANLRLRHLPSPPAPCRSQSTTSQRGRRLGRHRDEAYRERVLGYHASAP